MWRENAGDLDLTVDVVLCVLGESLRDANHLGRLGKQGRRAGKEHRKHADLAAHVDSPWKSREEILCTLMGK